MLDPLSDLQLDLLPVIPRPQVHLGLKVVVRSVQLREQLPLLQPQRPIQTSRLQKSGLRGLSNKRSNV